MARLWVSGFHGGQSPQGLDGSKAAACGYTKEEKKRPEHSEGLVVKEVLCLVVAIWV